MKNALFTFAYYYFYFTENKVKAIDAAKSAIQ